MKKLLPVFLTLLIQLAFGQSQKIVDPYIQSPNVASLGIYGKVDVSPFTGLPNINIPVFSVSYGDIPISANLQYLGGGVKIEDHPGWVGQNWSLIVGGVVSRKRNGGVDEIYVNNFTNANAFSYYFNYGGLDNSGWDQSTFMKTYLGSSDASKLYPQLSPDEFMFTLPNGKSGSFMKNEKGAWVVRSNDGGRLLIDVSLSPSTPLLKLYETITQTNYQLINQIIYKIVITDDAGYKYTFGGDLNAVEFIRESNLNADDAKNNVFANAWHLVEIESPKRNIVKFNYERGRHQYIQNVGYSHTLSYQINGQSCSGYNISTLQFSGYIITPSFLTSINSDAFDILFEKEVSLELKYPYFGYTSAIIPHAFNNFNYGDFASILFPDITKNGEHLVESNPPVDYKLKGITIKDKGGKIIEKYGFNYNNDFTDIPEQRLFLTSFTKTPSQPYLWEDGTVSQPMTYSFNYDAPETLPPYNSMMADEWGYYNGKPYPIHDLDVNTNLLKSKYLPDYNFAKKGSLIKITYPTGGYTNFLYELNQYGSYIKKNPGTVSLFAASGEGGGLRIRKIDNYSKNGVNTFKEYFYNNSSTGTSSGILAGLKNIYYRAQIGSSSKSVLGYAEYVSNNSISDLNYTNGRDVVYSEVKEILEDGASNVYKYSNSDNINYRDEAPNNIYAQGFGLSGGEEYGTSSFSFDPSYTFPLVSHTSREMERGKLLSRETFSALGKIVSKQENQYRDDDARFLEYVRSYNYTGQQITCALGFILERYVEPVKFYTYFPYLKSQKDYSYDYNGNVNTTLTKEYTYDNVYNVIKKEKFNNSKNENVETNFSYSFDFPSNSIYSGMLSKNLVSNVVQTSQLIDNKPVILDKTTYSLLNSVMYLPTGSAVQSGNGSVKNIFYGYDTFGNLASVSDEGLSQRSYLWGYHLQYPIAEVKGAALNQVAYADCEEVITDSHEDYYGTNIRLSGNASDFSTDSKTGHYSYRYADNSPVIESITPFPAGVYILNYWSKGGAATYDDSDHADEYIDLPADAKGWEFHQVKITLATSKFLRIFPQGSGNTILLDDIRVFPEGAQMTTYNYDPLVGMTSQADAKGLITYYEYDEMKRLKVIRDYKGNIIKVFSYNYGTSSSDTGNSIR